MSEDILRTALFEEDASPCEIGGAAAAWQVAEVISRGKPSGARVQIPGAVCFHFTTLFGFMI